MSITIDDPWLLTVDGRTHVRQAYRVGESSFRAWEDLDMSDPWLAG